MKKNIDRTPLFRLRPFKTKNADEYNLNDILSLFVNPIDDLRSPLDYENSIIKGSMGSGKTMLLRANYAYYLYNLVPKIIQDKQLILPVFIKLNDFQHIDEPNEIYRQIIIKIVEEISSIYIELQDKNQMANIHLGMRKIPSDLYFEEKMQIAAKKLMTLGSIEYVEKISNEFGINGELKHPFFKLSSKFKKTKLIELKQKEKPGIKDIEDIYNLLLKDRDGKIILLLDEAGALEKKFFKKEGNDSVFEVLMNQLRTTDFIRTKIAIYPYSYSDTLTETRYGDIIHLEEEIVNYDVFLKFRKRVISIINNYLNIHVTNSNDRIAPWEIFDISKENVGDAIEQIIYGSKGNYRRLIHLLDIAMNEAYRRGKGKDKIRIEDALLGLKNHCQTILKSYSNPEKEFLYNIANVCKKRRTNRFKFPNNSQFLNKYTTRSQEFNIVNIIEVGVGRKGTTYSFDYSFCIYKELATHLLKGTEKIDKLRSFKTGDWVSRNVTINDESIRAIKEAGKITGIIDWYENDKGEIRDESVNLYHFSKDDIIQSHRNKSIESRDVVFFLPKKIGKQIIASEIEII